MKELRERDKEGFENRQRKCNRGRPQKKDNQSKRTDKNTKDCIRQNFLK